MLFLFSCFAAGVGFHIMELSSSWRSVFSLLSSSEISMSSSSSVDRRFLIIGLRMLVSLESLSTRLVGLRGDVRVLLVAIVFAVRLRCGLCVLPVWVERVP